MVLQLQSKGSKLAAGLSGLREGLAQGFAMGTTARRTQLAEREQQAQEERYKQSVALASQAAALDAAREKRYSDEQTRNNQLQDEQRQGMRDLTNSRIDAITPEQTEPGFIKEGGMIHSDFNAGLMQHHDRVLSHAKSVAEKLPPVMLDQFWSDVQAGLQRDQNEAFASKTQSDWSGLLRDTSSTHGAGGVEDLLPEVQQRAKDNIETLQAAQALPPGPARDKAIFEAQQASRGALESQRKDIREVRTRRLKINALVNSYQPAIDRRRAALYGGTDGSGPVVDHDLVPTMEARLDAQQDVLERAKIDPDMTTEQFMSDWQRAGSVTVPTGRRGSGAGEGGGPGATDTKSLDRDAQIRKDAAARADKKFEAQSKLEDDDPNKLPWESIFAQEYQILGGKGDRAPEHGAPSNPAPTEPPPPPKKPVRSFAKLPTEERAGLLRTIQSDMKQGGQQLQAIFEHFGVDPESLPEDELKALLGTKPSMGKRFNDVTGYSDAGKVTYPPR